jgi:hypothetical protein
MYPKPDRSNYVPNEEPRPVDIGWNEGVLSDGRPYRVECWAEDGITSLSFFFSTLGLENCNNQQFAALLEREGLLTFGGEKRYCGARPMTDASGNDMWSVNVVVGDEEELYVTVSGPLRPYQKGTP